MSDNVGRFELRVSPPYPAWVEIRIDGERVGSIHHKELRDLAYAVERAMRDAREKLRGPGRDDSHEV